MLHIFYDRAEALEQAWVYNNTKGFRSSNSESLANATLFSWRRDLAEGKRPAVIFNASIAETGERLTFSTSRFQEQSLTKSQRDFSSSYPGYDISISTAVRLSATFPVVSPAARPLVTKDSTGTEPINELSSNDDHIPELHLVDGGYFDSTGLTTLSTWLDTALEDLTEHRPSKVPKKILIIQILAFPEPKTDNKTSHGAALPKARSPLKAFWNVSTKVEAASTQIYFAFVQKRWELEAYNPSSQGRISPIRIQLVNATYTTKDEDNQTPLSWHLRKSEQNAIEESWRAFKASSSMQEIDAFFHES